MTQKRFDAFMGALCTAFDKELTEGMASVYRSALSSYSDERIEAAYRIVVKRNKFFPRPAEIAVYAEMNIVQLACEMMPEGMTFFDIAETSDPAELCKAIIGGNTAAAYELAARKVAA